MDAERILIGSVIAVFCVILFVKERWFLEHTNKGRRLTLWFGQNHAHKVLRGLILGGIVFGILLATGVIHPIRWN